MNKRYEIVLKRATMLKHSSSISYKQAVNIAIVEYGKPDWKLINLNKIQISKGYPNYLNSITLQVGERFKRKVTIHRRKCKTNPITYWSSKYRYIRNICMLDSIKESTEYIMEYIDMVGIENIHNDIFYKDINSNLHLGRLYLLYKAGRLQNKNMNLYSDNNLIVPKKMLSQDIFSSLYSYKDYIKAYLYRKKFTGLKYIKEEDIPRLEDKAMVIYSIYLINNKMKEDN